MNVSFKNIDIIDSKQNGISVNNYNNSTKVIGICMDSIHINGTNLDNSGQTNGLYISSAVRGKLYYKNITFENISGSNIINQANITNFTLVESTEEPCNDLISVGIENIKTTNDIEIFCDNGILKITGIAIGNTFSIYNILGVKVYTKEATNTNEYVASLENGLYTITIDGTKTAKKILIKNN